MVVARDQLQTNATRFIAEYTARAGAAAAPERVSYAAGTVDTCPFDEAKRDPGTCGCGTPDVDSDGDGIADCVDPEPHGQVHERNVEELQRLAWLWPVAGVGIVAVIAACCIFVACCGNHRKRKRDAVRPVVAHRSARAPAAGKHRHGRRRGVTTTSSVYPGGPEGSAGHGAALDEVRVPMSTSVRGHGAPRVYGHAPRVDRAGDTHVRTQHVRVPPTGRLVRGAVAPAGAAAGAGPSSGPPVQSAQGGAWVGPSPAVATRRRWGGRE